MREYKPKKIPPKLRKEIEEKISDPKERESALEKLSRPKIPPHMPGYPKWYGDLCPRPKEKNEYPLGGPSKISVQRRITHKLLRLMWEGKEVNVKEVSVFFFHIL